MSILEDLIEALAFKVAVRYRKIPFQNFLIGWFIRKYTFITMTKRWCDHGHEGAWLSTGVAADPTNRADREVPRHPQGRGIHLDPGVHPAGDPGEVGAGREESPAVIFFFLAPL